MLSGLFLIVFLFLLFYVLAPSVFRKCFPHLGRAENMRMLGFLLILTPLTLFPYLSSKTFITGDDLYFHLTEIKGIAAALRAGYFPVRILPDALNGYGYGSGFYYPNFFLTIPALLILLGFYVMDAYKIFIALCSFFAFLTMFLTVRRISQSEKASYAAVILYACSAYRLIDIYYRSALGEIQAFIFLPLIILGLYEIFHSHPERWWIFALAFTGLLECHMISLAIAGIFTGIWTLLHVRQIFSDKKILLALLKSVVLTVLLGASFLFPMFEQTATNDLRIKLIMLDPVNNSLGQYTPWQSLLRFFYDWNNEEVVEHIFPGWWNYGIAVRYVYPGWSLLILPVLRLVMLRKMKTPVLKLADRLTIYGFFALIACTDIFPWQFLLPLLFRIQFSWRIMMIATVLLSVSCGIYAAEMMEKYLSGKNLLLQFLPLSVLSLSVGLPILIETQSNRCADINEYRRIERSSIIHGAEYLPVGFDRALAEQTGDNVICDATGFVMENPIREALSFTFDFRLPESVSDARMRVPLTFYTGYHAYLTDEAGKRVKIPVERDELGLVSVTNGQTNAGTITVRFERTDIQLASDIISLAALLYCLLRFLQARFSHRQGNMPS